MYSYSQNKFINFFVNIVFVAVKTIFKHFLWHVLLKHLFRTNGRQNSVFTDYEIQFVRSGTIFIHLRISSLKFYFNMLKMLFRYWRRGSVFKVYLLISKYRMNHQICLFPIKLFGVHFLLLFFL